MTWIVSLLGLNPVGSDPGASVAALRLSLTLGAVIWAWLTLRARPAVSLAAGLLWAVCGIGFWVLYLGRPWGLFEDVETMRRAAEIAVAAATGAASEGFLTGTPAAHGAWTAWLGRGIGAEALIRLPTVLPLVVVPGVAVALFVLVRPRERAWLAAVLWLLLSTGDLDTLRGLGVLPELWRRPGAGLGVLLAAAVTLLLARLWFRPAAGAGPVVACALPGLAAAALTAPGPDLTGTSALLALTLDQGLLLVAAAVGLVRFRGAAGEGLAPSGDPAARGLVLGGALGVLVGVVTPSLNVWSAHACYRLGLILAMSGPLAQVLDRAYPQRLGRALIVLVIAPASFVTWWAPPRLDPFVEASRQPLPRALTEATDWIRRATPPGAVFLASDAQAPAVAILGGRRLLRAPRLLEPVDDAKRADAEYRLLRGRRRRDWVKEYEVRYIFAAPGEFAEIEASDLAASVVPSGRQLAYSHPKGYRVYEIVR